MKNPERIIRLFERERRDGFIMIYPFTTFSTIWDEPMDRPNLLRLYRYFRQLIQEGVPDATHKKSVSKGEPLVNLKTVKRVDEEIIKFACDSCYEGHGNQQHPILQEHMLKMDVCTLAIEIPVYNEEWHGHIDIIRYIADTDKVEVLDFKPHADKETKASFQVFRYMKLLSAATMITMDDITGKYFDNVSSYKVKF